MAWNPQFLAEHYVFPRLPLLASVAPELLLLTLLSPWYSAKVFLAADQRTGVPLYDRIICEFSNCALFAKFFLAADQRAGVPPYCSTW